MDEDGRVRFRIANEIPMSAEDLWNTAHKPEFLAFLAGEHGLMQREMERKIRDRWMHWRVRVTVCRSLPDFINKLVRGVLGAEEIAYDEIHEKRLDDFELFWRIESPMIKEKVQGSGTVRLMPMDGGRCLRTIEGEIHVRVFGVGGTMEKFIAREIQEASRNLAGLVVKWKARETGRQPRRTVPARELAVPLEGFE
jgi:hypothetical protein